MKIKGIIGLIIGIALIMSSCATGVSVRVMRPAELDLGHAQSISVLPFGLTTDEATRGLSPSEIYLARFLGYANSPNRDEQNIARRLADGITQGLVNANFMQVVPVEQVINYLRSPNGQPPVDVYLSGSFTQFNTIVDSVEVIRKINNVDTKVRVYFRKVEFNVDYQVVDARTNRIIAMKSKYTSRQSNQYDSYAAVRAVIDVIQSELASMTQDILRSLQPYEVTLFLTMVADETKDPAMAEADEIVKDGQLQPALDKFKQIYAATGNFAAGYNAAILTQAAGRLQEALEMMQALATATGDRRASGAAVAIQTEIDNANRVQQQTTP